MIHIKKLLSIVGLFFICSIGYAQTIKVHNSGDTMYANALSSIDSIKFDNTYSKFTINGVGSTLNIQKALIDSITFTNSAIAATKIYIIYNGTDDPTIINPYASKGVAITASGAAVTVTGASGISNLEYNLLGTSTTGSFTMSSTSPANLVLNNLNITNASGSAISITGGQAHTFTLKAGTSNSLTDGSASTRNGTLQTDGKIIVNGTGALTVAGIRRHGIYTTSSIEVQSSTVTISAAASDGLHSEGFVMSGGTVGVTASTGDGIDAGDGAVSITGGTVHINSSSVDVKALKTGNGAMTISGGTFTLNVSGNASKALSAKTITIGAGTFAINLSGAALLAASGSGYNPSYCTAVKSDGLITVNGGNFTIQATAAAAGAKGFSANSNITITDGTFTVTTAAAAVSYTNTSGVADVYRTTAFSADADINISGGQFTLTNSGNDGRLFSSDAGINVSGGTLNISNSGAAGRGLNADGNISFAGGSTTINLSGATVLNASGSGFDPSYPTAVKADGIISVQSGTVQITASSAATGARGFSADSIINVSGGTVTISTAGNGAVYKNASGATDSYAAAAFSSDRSIIITGGLVTTTSSGTGGKGLKSDGTITIGSAAAGGPTINLTTTGARFLVSGTDYNHPKTLVANGAVSIINGTLTINSTDDGIHSDVSITISGGDNKVTAISATTGVGEGVEAPIINFTGGVTNVTASNDGINATYGTVSGGIESNDGSQLNISGGILIVTGGDAIDSNGNITITGGTTVVCGPAMGQEEGIDFNGNFLMNGGVLISGAPSSGMTKAMNTTSTQVGMFLKSGTQLPATAVLHIENAAGTEMVTFKPKNNASYFHFSTSALAQGTQYKVYFGGTYTGGSFVGNSSGWGLYTGGTYSATGATLKSTFTTSTSSKVNTVSF